VGESISDGMSGACGGVGNDQIWSSRETALKPIGEAANPVITVEVHVRRSDAPNESAAPDEWSNGASDKIGASKKAVNNLWPFTAERDRPPQEKSHDVPSAGFPKINDRNPAPFEVCQEGAASIEKNNFYQMAPLSQSSCQTNELSLGTAHLK